MKGAKRLLGAAMRTMAIDKPVDAGRGSTAARGAIE